MKAFNSKIFFVLALSLLSSVTLSAAVEYVNGYKIINKTPYFNKCDGEDYVKVYIDVDHTKYPKPNSFSISNGGTMGDTAKEALCINHSSKEIFLRLDKYQNEYVCSYGEDINSSGLRISYSPCNSIFFSTDSGQTTANHLIGCLLVACLPSLVGVRSVIFKGNHIKVAVNALNLTSYRNWKYFVTKLQTDLTILDRQLKNILGYEYDFYSYDLDDFKRDYSTITRKFDSIEDQIQSLSKQESNTFFREHLANFRNYQTKFESFKKFLPDLVIKEVKFQKLQREGKAAADERIRLAKIEKEQKAKERQIRLALEEAEKELTRTTKKILYNLGYEIDDFNENFDLKTKTALVAFQKDFDILPVSNEPTEELLVELQRAFRNSPNPLDLTNYEMSGSGSGFLVNNDGFVITNVHVVEECSLITVGKRIPANIEKADRRNDVAILKVGNTGNYEALQVAKNDAELGEQIFVAGFPINMILENLNFTAGSISSEVGVGQNINQFQFTAPIQPGNSGGPIFNEYGGVVGIAQSTASTKEFEELLGTNIQNINFGVKISTIKSLLDQADIEIDIGNPNWFSGQKNVASVAKKGTVLIQCWSEK